MEAAHVGGGGGGGKIEGKTGMGEIFFPSQGAAVRILCVLLTVDSVLQVPDGFGLLPARHDHVDDGGLVTLQSHS